jgi:hypothetical protein
MQREEGDGGGLSGGLPVGERGLGADDVDNPPI